MSEPLISVIIPTHNRARLLVRSVESVLNQTHRHLELIVVDDASTDDTSERLRHLDDERLRVVRLESKGGAPALDPASTAGEDGSRW